MNDVRCVFCEKYGCDCEESKALEWLLTQDDPPRWSAFDVAKALVAYRVEHSLNYSSEADMVDCLSCPACGWSVTK